MSVHRFITSIIIPLLCLIFIGKNISKKIAYEKSLHNLDNTDFYNIVLSKENGTCYDIENSTIACLGARQCGQAICSMYNNNSVNIYRISPKTAKPCHITTIPYANHYSHIWIFWIESIIFFSLHVLITGIIFYKNCPVNPNILAAGFILVRLHTICLSMWYMVMDSTMINIILYSWVQTMFVAELIFVFCIVKNRRREVFDPLMF